jgi:hypothetical protein
MISLGNLPLYLFQAIIYLGAFSRFTHGRYTRSFHQYQVERAPDNAYTQLIPVFDVMLSTLLFSRRARLWASLFCAVAQGGGVVKRVRDGKRVRWDVGILVIAVVVTGVAWQGT